MNISKKKLVLIGLLWLIGLALLVSNVFQYDMQNYAEADAFGTIVMLMIAGLMLATVSILGVLELPRFLNKLWVIAGFLAMPYIMVYVIQAMSGTPAEELPANIFALNYFWCLVVYVLLFVGNNHYRATMVLGTVITFVVGAVNYFVMDFRGTPFQITDILSIGTAADVAGNYDIVITPLLFWLGAIAFFAVCVGHFYQCRVLCMNPITFAGSALILVACLWAIGNFYSTDNWSKNHLAVNFWNPTAGYEQNGTVLSLAMSGKYLKAEKPDNYSAALAESIVLNGSGGNDKITGNWSNGTTSSQVKYLLNARKNNGTKTSVAEEPVRPNIIAIMNESYADLGMLGELEPRIPYMAFYNSLKDNTIRGNLTVSVLGGGTCNTEFEFLTGLSMAFLPSGVMAYQQYITGNTESIATQLKAQGYETVAFHPGKGESWRRNKVYPYLGFDSFYTEKDMKDPEYMRGAYVSDSSDYKELIRIFEEKEKDTPLFMFNVTIQNHGGYNLDTVGIPRWVSIKNLKGHYPETEEYLSLMAASDQALKELITYFQKVKEPTLIVFFGDHQPSVEPELVEELMGKTPGEMDLQEVMQRYQVPFFIWANYDIEEDYYEAISANYLAALTMQTAGVEMSPYMHYLVNLQEQLPMIDSLCYRDNKLEYYRFGEDRPEQALIDDYRVVQYNYLFGGRNRLSYLYGLTTAEKSE